MMALARMKGEHHTTLMLSTSYEQVREQVLQLPFESLKTVKSALSLPSEEQQKLLAELKDHPPVRIRRVQAHDFSREQQWLRENRHLYRGQYLAVSGDQLVAHGTNPKEVLEKARASGKDFLLSRVPAEGENYGGGLW